MPPRRRGQKPQPGKKREHPGQGVFWPDRSSSPMPKKQPPPGKKEEPREVIHLVPRARPRGKHTLELTGKINFDRVDAKTAMGMMKKVMADARKKGYTKIECPFEGEKIERVLVSLGFRRVYYNTGGWGPEDRQYVYVRTLS